MEVYVREKNHHLNLSGNTERVQLIVVKMSSIFSG